MHPKPRRPETTSWVREVSCRVGLSSLVWCGLGGVAGASSAPEPTPIGVIAGVLAGVIVLTPIGVILGLLGGRWLETLIGGGLGLVGGVVATLVQGGAWGQSIAFGVITGGL